MDQYTKVIDKKAATVSHLLEQGENLQSLGHTPGEKLFSFILGRARRGLDGLEEYVYQARSSTIVEEKLDSLKRRLARLTFNPSREVITYAQNLLCFPNLCLKDGEWAFDSHQRPAGLSDFVVINGVGNTLLQYSLDQDLAQSSQVWGKLHTVLLGNYVLCYDLILTQAQLLMTAEQYQFEAPVLIGGHFADIFALCSNSAGLLASAHTPDLLLRVPQPNAAWLFTPEQTVLERALTMLHALLSIAQGHQI